jgi:hypothetical protein
VPQGLSPDSTKLRFSVVATPRLVTDQTPPVLSLFPDWMRWPATVQGATFSLVPSGSPAIAATVVSSPPDLATWQRLFAPTATVQSFTWQSFAGRRIWSYPAKKVHDFIKSAYTEVLTQYPMSFPPNAALVGFTDVGGPAPGILGNVAFGQPFAPLPPTPPPTDSESLATKDIESAMAAPNFAVPPNHVWPVNAPGRYDLLQAKLFQAPRTPIPATATDSTTPRPTVPTFDFHQAVSNIGDHAGLQRLFGVVIDLEVPAAGIALPNTFHVAVTWAPALAQTTNVYPSTSADSSFLPAPRLAGGLVSGGLLQLQKPTFSVVEFDADGATQKLMETARTLWNRAHNFFTAPQTPTTSSVPSLRTGGLAVAWSGLASVLAKGGTGSLAFQDTLDVAAKASPPKPILLGAEDLTRGYRVDVFDVGANKWYQLCARSARDNGGYLIGSPPGPPVPVPTGDEGFVQLAPTGDGSGGTTDLWLQETVFRWNGWSLVGVRPGQQLPYDPHNPSGTVSDPGNPATPGFPISITYAATPGTLPRLRIGRSYRFRARAHDIAGGGLAFSSASTAVALATATGPITYLRLEPVASPQVLMRKPVTEAESVEVVVIRSNYNIPDNTVVPTDRHFAAPPMSQLLAEEHGLFDLSSGLPNVAAYSSIAARDGANFTGGTPDPRNQNAPYFSSNAITVPYLPDVLSRGTAFAGLPGVAPAGAIIKVPFAAGAWPNTRSFRLTLAAGSAAPVLPTGKPGAALVVSLPKGVTTTIQVSSYVKTTDLTLFALWHWVSPAFRAANTTAAANGAIWLLTPPRTMTLVHAVRQPNTAPSLEADFNSTRANIGDVVADVVGTAGTVDFDSTEHLDVLAMWSEPIDTGGNADPVTPQMFNAAVGSVLVPAPNGQNSVSLGTATTPLVHRFGDTKRHDVAYEVVGTTRYAKEFVQRATVTLHGTTPVVLNPVSPQPGLVPGSVIVASQPTGTPPSVTTYAENVDYVIDYGAATVARVAGGAIGDGQSVNVAFVVPPITRSSLETEPGGRMVTVQSSVRPAKPIVRRIIPAWSFSASSAGSSRHSSRSGGSLRIYLARPWWTSGPGELLGVVLPQTAPPSAATLYGNDPLHPGLPNPPPAPQRTDYTLAVAFAPSGGLTLPGVSGQVDVAGHAVSFDATQNLWYCDIDMVPAHGYYMPFIRLVVARFQPQSLSGVELSEPIVLDVAQAVPDRVATADVSGVNPSAPSPIPVQVSGPIGPGPYGNANVFRARVEQQVGGTDDINWQTVFPDTQLSRVDPVGDLVGTWSGTVTRPAGSGPFRVAITEVEQYFRGPSAPGSPNPGTTIGERMVYADVISV